MGSSDLTCLFRLIDSHFAQFDNNNTYVLLRQSQDMSEDTFVCDDCGEEFHVSEEADDGVCDWCWMVSGA